MLPPARPALSATPIRHTRRPVRTPRSERSQKRTKREHFASFKHHQFSPFLFVAKVNPEKVGAVRHHVPFFVLSIPTVRVVLHACLPGNVFDDRGHPPHGKIKNLYGYAGIFRRSVMEPANSQSPLRRKRDRRSVQFGLRRARPCAGGQRPPENFPVFTQVERARRPGRSPR